ncbi:MAG: hypothetical protein QOF28_2140 [Actinomycetota bacterium]|jgi:hypothetical protein|nr:hypothetical protein [Actinomycetota bacterium]
MEQPPVGAHTHPERVASWRFAERATPWLANAIAGGAGALGAVGVIAFGIDLYPDNRHDVGWAGLALCVVLVAAGLVLVVALPTLLESAGIAMIAIGVPGAMAFVQFPRVHSPDDLRPFFAVTIVAWLLGFAFGPARARPLLLSLALLLALTWATVEVADVNTASRVPFAPSFTFGSGSGSGSSSGGSTFTTNPDGSINPDSFPPSTDFAIGTPQEPNFGEIGGVSLAFGVVYLFGVALLDARGRRGIATAAVLPGVIAMVDAVIFFGAEAKSIVVAGLLSVAAGLYVGSVGTQSHRRFTVWVGAFGATVGAVLLAGKVTDSTTSGGSNSHAASVFGAFAIVFGAAMVAVAVLVARLLREPQTGDDRAASSTSSPPPDPPPPPPPPPPTPIELA